MGRPGRGRAAQRRRGSTRARRAAQRATGGSSCSGSSPPIPRWVAALDRRPRRQRAHRLRALGTIAPSLCQVAAARFDGMVTLRRCRAVDAAAGAADRARGRRPGQLHRLEDPLGAPLDAAPHSPVVAARDGRRRLPSLGAAISRRRMIDWILAERIAGYVAGDGRRARRRGRPRRARRRLRAPRGRLHGPAAGAAAAAARGDRPPRVDRDATSPRCARCSTRCSARGRRARARCRPAVAARASAVVTHRGRAGARLPGAARARPVRAGAARRGRAGRPPRLLFVLPNLGAAVRAFECRRATSS